MQNKGLVKLFAILFGLICIYQLSFTYVAGRVEDEAKAFAEAKVPNTQADHIAKRIWTIKWDKRSTTSELQNSLSPK